MEYKKNLFITTVFSFYSFVFFSQNKDSLDVIVANEVIVEASRANNKVPFSVTNLSKKEIGIRNMGQDIPTLLNLTPSFISNSETGNGIGHSNFRIRGTSSNRINFTVDGIPLNDAESRGIFLVNLPDLSSSIDNIQIQRGVGTSTNGAGAFGASINVQTQGISKDSYVMLSNTGGSFNTIKNNIKVGTGLKNGFAFDARFSNIYSDGFIDRAFSKLLSGEMTGGYYGKNTSIKLDAIIGKQRTYQAWNGVPSNLLKTNRTYNIYEYENQTDNYWQNHYKVLLTHIFKDNTKFNLALHYTDGEGYYEEYKNNDKYSNYGFTDSIIIGNKYFKKTDVIRRKWLQNDFYGFVTSTNSKKGIFDMTLGGGWNRYDGDHFGEIIWMKHSNENIYNSIRNKNTNKQEYYRGSGVKDDYNIYFKTIVDIFKSFNLFGDFQVRGINYNIMGFDDLIDITQSHSFLFFNPKLGVNYSKGNNRIFASISVANREPSRKDFVEARENKTPKQETLYDYELCYYMGGNRLSFEVNLYHMQYKNQLIQTGEVNDVGGAIFVNVDDSYRQGVELISSIKIIERLKLDFNATYSRNKINNFTEYIDDYSGGQRTEKLGTTDIAFSPKLISSGVLSYYKKNFNISLMQKYVSSQFIDNTSSNDRMIDSYFNTDLKLSYSFKLTNVKKVQFNFLINNLLNAEYETNAWVYSYYENNTRKKYDGYFPNAGINFLVGFDISI